MYHINVASTYMNQTSKLPACVNIIASFGLIFISLISAMFNICLVFWERASVFFFLKRASNSIQVPPHRIPPSLTSVFVIWDRMKSIPSLQRVPSSHPRVCSIDFLSQMPSFKETYLFSVVFIRWFNKCDSYWLANTAKMSFITLTTPQCSAI